MNWKNFLWIYIVMLGLLFWVLSALSHDRLDMSASQYLVSMLEQPREVPKRPPTPELDPEVHTDQWLKDTCPAWWSEHPEGWHQDAYRMMMDFNKRWCIAEMNWQEYQRTLAQHWESRP